MTDPLNSYKPGQSIRFTATLTVAGVLMDPTTVGFSVHSADGITTTVLTPVRDAQGVYHADFVVPFPAATPGVWAYRWQATGILPSQSALREGTFQVAPLDW
jgi:hypothetical protein